MTTISSVRRSALVLALVSGTALAGCGGSSDGSEGGGTSVVPTTSTDGSPSSSASTSTAVVSTSSTSPSSSTTSTTGSTTTSTTAPASSTTSAGSGFPPQRAVLEHGGTTWAVVLYGSEDAADPLFDNPLSVLTSVGYTSGITDCDQGAADVLGLPDGYSYLTLSVYFETEADARAAVTAFAGRGVDAVAGQVETYCLD